MADMIATIGRPPVDVHFGENTAGAMAAASLAESAAAAALAAAGVGEYADTAAGLSGTTIGETFWVDQGDGTGQVYRHDGGPVATALRPFILDPTDAGAADLIAGGIPTTAALGSPAGGGMVVLSDGSTVEDAVSAALKGAGAVGRKFAFFSGTVRQTAPGSGWVFVADANHQQVGFNPTLSLSGSALQISFDASVAKVVTMLAIPDEDYAAAGLTCGVSVGTGSALLNFYAPFEMRTAGTAAVFGNFIEAGVDATATVDVANGTITVTHNAMSHVDSNGSPLSIVNIGLPDGNQFANPASASKTGFVINSAHPIAGRVNAAAVTSLNLGSSAAWNGTDTLTITHPASGVSVNDVSLAPEAAGNIPICTGSTATTITVQFRDYAGTLVTGASSPGLFRYMRGGIARSALSGSTKLLVRRGPIPVRAAYVAGAGNIWLFAVMELA